MNPNDISVGGGLAVLGGSIFALACAMVVVSADGPAQADSRGLPAGRPVFAGDREEARLERRLVPTSAMPERGTIDGRGRKPIPASATGCVVDQTGEWFAAARELPECFGYDDLEASLQDWNGDGILDWVSHVYSVPVLIAGVPAEVQCVAYRTEAEFAGDAVEIRRDCIATSALLQDFATARFPGKFVSTYFDSGWRDFDGDGDLDLVLVLKVGSDPVMWESLEFVWLENTGFEATQPLVGDLNRDGNVNSADLAMLLGGWTGG